MIVKYSRRARIRLDYIHSRISEDNPHAADRVIARILQSIQYLETFPELGRSGRANGTRELSVAGLPYIAVYRIEKTCLRILTVIHARQKWPPS